MKFKVLLVSKKYFNPLDSHCKPVDLEVEFEAYDKKAAQGYCEILKLHDLETKNLEEIKD